MGTKHQQTSTKMLIRILKANRDKGLDDIAAIMNDKVGQTKYGTPFPAKYISCAISRIRRETGKDLRPGVKYARNTIKSKPATPDKSSNDKIALADLILGSQMDNNDKLRLIKALV